ncbi:twin-arginine translocase TatA/TatE family subunit [Pontiella sp.]|uniref:Sec-independent protein translocase subunit TatA/TatB n=1 Tax=Pontiella sp. TaxID=2837462 RepID=UPI003564FEAE
MNTLALGMPGGQELLVVAFIIILLFGAKKLPELSRSLGKSLGEFKKGQREGAEPDQIDDEVEKKEIASDDGKDKE